MEFLRVLNVSGLPSSLLIALVALTGCSSADNMSSKLRVQFPPAPTLSAQGGPTTKIAAQGLTDFTWSKVCFTLNVTAVDLKKPIAGLCDVTTGVFSGSVPAGGELTLDVPRGSARKLEVFAYLRNSSSDPCPTLKDGFQGLDRTRIVRVGLVPSFDVNEPIVTLAVDVTAPVLPADNLIAQYQLPSSCRPVSVPSGGAARVALGSAQQSGGRFKVTTTVAAQKNELELSGGKFKVHLSRRPE